MNDLFNRVWAKKVSFLGTFFIVFTVSYLLLVAVDFLPEEPTKETEVAEETSEIHDDQNMDTSSSTEEESTDPPPTEASGVSSYVSDEEIVISREVILPTKVYFERLDRTVEVFNPTSRAIADLDEALLGGVVRHPDSATLDQEGNVFILGHSSYLPNVFNKNFQAFNGIQNLEWGDIIEVTSGDLVFVYAVDQVYKAKAQEVTVPIANTGKMLTIATCNSFGSTDDRYIVEAKQVEVKKI